MSKKGIIFETLNEVKSLNIKEDDGFLHLSGVCGVRNNTQRVYETKNYAKMVESMQERLKKAPIPGELEHPSSMNITTENISHRIDSISIDENGVVTGEITLLNTPKGKIAQEIVRGGLPLFISSRAQGQVDRNGNVTLENIQTYDLVGSPGFSQAELHLNESQMFESINESMCIITDEKDDEEPDNQANENNQNNEDMNEETLKQIQEQLEEMKGQIEELTQKNEALQEQLDSKQDIDVEKLCEGIQNWVVNEFSPEVQKWITEQYSAKVQEWVVNEFSPEVQKWVVEHYSPEVQKWVVEEFAPEVQNWLVEQYSPAVQGWLTEHCLPEVENKINESLTEKFNDSLNEKIEERLKASKNEKLQNIDSVLSMLESHQTQKPVYGRKSVMLNENQDEPKYIQQMPAEKRVQWNMASAEIRESVERRAKLYNFNQEGAIEHFWESVDLTKAPQTKDINEGLDKIQDEWEKNIRASIRGWHKA